MSRASSAPAWVVPASPSPSADGPRSPPGAAAAWRACKALGGKIITYTLPEEGGASLRASGFTLVGEAGGGRWNRPGRPAAETHPIGKKLRWELAC
jgi:hypothetical protein